MTDANDESNTTWDAFLLWLSEWTGVEAIGPRVASEQLRSWMRVRTRPLTLSGIAWFTVKRFAGPAGGFRYPRRLLRPSRALLRFYSVAQTSRPTVFGPLNTAEHVASLLDEYRWLFDTLADAASRELLVLMLVAQISGNKHVLPSWFMRSGCSRYDQYFDKGIIGKSDNHVFVDCGASWGDTYLSFVQSYSSRFKKMYCYESDASTFARLERATGADRRVVRRFAAIADTATSLSASGKDCIPIQVTLDEDIPSGDRITFVKFDVEGYESRSIRDLHG